MTSARDLADRFHERWLEENPFAATSLGISGYDDLVPDESDEGRQAWRAEVEQFLTETRALADQELALADAITLDCTEAAAAMELDSLILAGEQYTVTAMQFSGPASLLAVTGRTVLVNPAAAEAYLTRLRRSGVWLDQISAQLRGGAAKGRVPVAPLAEQAIAWAENILAAPDSSPLLSPRPPQGWDRAAAWETERRAAADEVVHPALARWIETVREVLPLARSATKPGLVYLPGGADDYARAVRIYTTLPLSPDQLHQTGLDQLQALEARATALGADLGLHGLTEVFAAMRESSGELSAEEAIRQAVEAVRRAEARRGTVPWPPPAAVRGNPHAAGGRAGRHGTALHPAPPRRRTGRHVLVQHRAAYRGHRMGPRGNRLPRSGTRPSPPAVPPPAAP
jgi:uncharacterized protein (DUF885 family)